MKIISYYQLIVSTQIKKTYAAQFANINVFRFRLTSWMCDASVLAALNLDFKV